MADDIIARLNEVWEYAPTYPWQRNAINDAKAEIERLRAERDAERALADQLAEALCQMVTWSCCPDGNFGPCGCGPDVPRLPEGEENAEAIATWEEARRG